MRKFASITLFLALSACGGGHPAYATPLGPPLDKCFPVEQREDGLKALREMSSGVQSFDAASSKKLIDTLNAQEPATSWEASQVDAGVRLTDGHVFVFFSDDKLTCLVAVENKPVWDKLEDQAFGQGT